MWVAKIKFSEQGTLMGTKAIKYHINIFGFPLSFYYEKDWIIVNITGSILGKNEDKKNFIKELKKEKRVINFEINNDFFIGIIKEPIYAKPIYNKDIIHIAPTLISDQDYEIITIASFKKESLVEAFKIIEKKLKGKLLFLQNKNIKSISIMKVHPNLTEKQKNAIELAIKNGYYNSPRKINVKQLSKISNLSFSTYQVHLRKAEKKLIPYFFE